MKRLYVAQRRYASTSLAPGTYSAAATKHRASGADPSERKMGSLLTWRRGRKAVPRKAGNRGQVEETLLGTTTQHRGAPLQNSISYVACFFISTLAQMQAHFRPAQNAASGEGSLVPSPPPYGQPAVYW